MAIWHVKNNGSGRAWGNVHGFWWGPSNEGGQHAFASNCMHRGSRLCVDLGFLRADALAGGARSVIMSDATAAFGLACASSDGAVGREAMLQAVINRTRAEASERRRIGAVSERVTAWESRQAGTLAQKPRTQGTALDPQLPSGARTVG